METTIIRLEPNTNNQPMVVRAASFEEAFGDYSEARGRGRARRKKRRLSRIADRDEVRRARQDARLGRRQDRKRKRQEIRGEQQEARMSRRERRLQMRQEREEARQTRRDTRARGRQERKNYKEEQRNYRDSLGEERDEREDDGAGYSDQGGGYDDQGGGAGYSDQGGGYDDAGYDDGSSSGGSYDSSEDWATPPSGMYEDEGYVDEGYSSDDEMMSEDDSYFNAEGTDGKSRPVNPKLVDFVARIEEEQRQVQQMLKQLKMMMKAGQPTKGIQMQVKRRCQNINKMKKKLSSYSCADGDKKLERLRKMEIRKAIMKVRGQALAKGRGVKAGLKRRLTKVQSSLNPRFSPNRIVIPSKRKSTFDGEMITDEMTDVFLPDNNSDYNWSDDLAPDNFSFADGSMAAYDDAMNYMDFDYDLQTEDGRPVVFEDSNIEKYKDYVGDDYPTPRTYEIKSNFTGEGKVVWKSIAIGVGLGVLALYLAKRYKILK